MKRALHFLADYWYIPALIAGVVLVWILTAGKRAPPIGTITRELDAINAKRDARNMQAELGAAAATAKVKAKYAEKWKTLDAEAKAKVEELEDDPVALAVFLERVSR